MDIIESIKSQIKTLLSQVEVTELSFYGATPNEDGTGMPELCISGSLYKQDEKQIVYGFASVIEVDGEALVDKHGDIIDEETLTQAAHLFMTDYRSGKAMHKGEDVGEIVESIVFTKDLQKALGIDLGVVGWFVGYQVHDEKIWKQVKDGELSMFSIGGTAIKEKVNG